MSDKLFNTEEAAGFLRVSEASIRRWSDAGLLPARRIGRRRERRFTEADLIKFLGGQTTASTPRAEAPYSAVNVGGVAVPLHGHLATFYNSDAGRLRLTLPFFSDGLRAGQPCFLVASGAVLDVYFEALRSERGINIDGAVKEGRFVTVAGPGSNLDEALSFWEQACWRALASGPTVVRIAGEMACTRKGFSSDAEMMRFEAALDGLVKRFPTLTLCQYDVREFDGETVFQAMRAHPDLFGLHLGTFLH